MKMLKQRKSYDGIDFYLGTRKIGCCEPVGNKIQIYFQIGDVIWKEVETQKEAEEWLEKMIGFWLVEANCEYKG